MAGGCWCYCLVPGDTVVGDIVGTEFMHESNSSSTFNFSSLCLKLEADFWIHHSVQYTPCSLQQKLMSNCGVGRGESSGFQTNERMNDWRQKHWYMGRKECQLQELCVSSLSVPLCHCWLNPPAGHQEGEKLCSFHLILRFSDCSALPRKSMLYFTHYTAVEV